MNSCKPAKSCRSCLDLSARKVKGKLQDVSQTHHMHKHTNLHQRLHPHVHKCVHKYTETCAVLSRRTTDGVSFVNGIKPDKSLHQQTTAMHHHTVETHPNISPLTTKHECANTPANHLPWHTNQQNRQRVLSYSSNANVFTTPTHTDTQTDTQPRHTQTHRQTHSQTDTQTDR